MKYELDAVRLLLTEQNVLTVSSISALKETKEDLSLLKAILRDREADLSELSPEISRLNSALGMEKRHNLQLREKLAREAALREDMEKLLPEPGQRIEDLERNTRISAPDLRDKFSSISRSLREGRSRRFSRGYY